MTRPILSLALVLLLHAAPSYSCGITPTCSDVNTSYTGTIIIEGFRLNWSSDDADTGVGFFRLYVYPTGSPGSARWLADIAAHQDCSAHNYQFTDTPASGSWTWRLETWPDVGTSPCYATVSDTIP